LRDPEKWAQDVQAKANSVKAMRFPGDGANVFNESEIKTLIETFDSNGDGTITNAEIWNTF